MNLYSDLNKYRKNRLQYIINSGFKPNTVNSFQAHPSINTSTILKDTFENTNKTNGTDNYTEFLNSKQIGNEKPAYLKTQDITANRVDNVSYADDAQIHEHSMRVALYSIILAKELGVANNELESIETAGLLHDIGKIAIPESILCKPGKLTDDEFAVMKTHPINSEKLISSIERLHAVSPGVKYHHERWDGRGYPDHLKGEDIPFSARIIAIADTYDAMTSTRSYRKALDHEVAIAEIEKCAGAQFDPELAKKFVEIQDIIKAAKNNPEEYYMKYSSLLNKTS